MTLSFRSSRPEQFAIIGVDPDGRKRTVVATKRSGEFNWRLELTHPSGRNWDATYHGGAVLDAMSELLASKDVEFKQDRARGDRPHEPAYDGNRAVDADIPPITTIRRF
ncbi:hypothetical protein ABIA99_005264 [Bradyrhizobium sp. LB12.1]